MVPFIVNVCFTAWAFDIKQKALMHGYLMSHQSPHELCLSKTYHVHIQLVFTIVIQYSEAHIASFFVHHRQACMVLQKV